MKILIFLFLLSFLLSCGNSKTVRNITVNEAEQTITPDIFEIISVKKNDQIKKINIEVRLKKVVSEGVLRQIALQLKDRNPAYVKLYVFYYLIGHKIGNGAWATTHFTPNLEVIILGTSEASLRELNDSETSNNVVNVWIDNDAIMPNKIYLIDDNGILTMKTMYAKNKYSEATEIVNIITKSKQDGLTRFDYKNTHREYYLVEKNGNLGVYDNDGKFKEAVLE